MTEQPTPQELEGVTKGLDDLAMLIRLIATHTRGSMAPVGLGTGGQICQRKNSRRYGALLAGGGL